MKINKNECADVNLDVCFFFLVAFSLIVNIVFSFVCLFVLKKRGIPEWMPESLECKVDFVKF